MDVNLGIWSKLTKVVVALVVTAFVLLIGIYYLPLLHQNERMRADILRLQTQLQKEEEISKQLQAEIQTLRNDPKTIERLTREKLGYARPGETIIRFEQPPTNAPPRCIKPGATVVDVGTSSIDGKLMGDVDFDSAIGVASLVTPVPGGVGPVTIAMLLYNTLLTACLQKDVSLAFNPDELGSPAAV